MHEVWAWVWEDLSCHRSPWFEERGTGAGRWQSIALYFIFFCVCSAGEGCCDPSGPIHSLGKLRRVTSVKSGRLCTSSRSHEPSLLVSGVNPELLKGALRHKKTPHHYVGELYLLIPGIYWAFLSPRSPVAVKAGAVPWGGSQRDLLLR